MSTWVTASDDASGAVYYWNTSTNEVRWEPPADDDQGSSSQPGDEWTFVLDESGGGKDYWWHPATNEVAWERPATAPAVTVPATATTTLPTTAPVAPVEPVEPAPPAAANPAPAAPALPAALVERLAQRKILNAQPAAPARALDAVRSALPPRPEPPSPALPPGWKSMIDPSGKAFYRHSQSGQVSWTHPAIPNPTVGSAAQLPPATAPS